MTFEEFEDILRISWEPEVWGPWVPFVHFLDFLRTLWTFWGLFEDLWTWGSQNIEDFSGPFDDFLLTYWGPEAFEDFKDFLGYWGSLRTWLHTEDFEDVDKLLRTLRSPWIPFVDLWGLRGLWWPLEEFEDILRISWEPEVWVPWVPFMHFLDILWTLWTFEDFLKTWGPDALRTLKNISGTFDDILWTIWGLYLGTFEDFLRTI